MLVCLRIIIELHKQFRPPLQSEVQYSIMSNNYYIIVNIYMKYHFIISSHLTMYFPVERCFIIIVKFVKNIFVVNYYYRSYSFAKKEQKGKIIVTTMSYFCGKKMLGILNLMILIGFFHGLFSLLLFKTRCGWTIISSWPFFLKALGP